MRREADPTPETARRRGHGIDITRAGTRVRALVAGRVLADSRNCLLLREAGYPPIHYFPRADVRMDLLARTDHRSHCPFKGDACYWSAGGLINVAWSYESPHEDMQAIAEHIAFYPDRVTIEPD